MELPELLRILDLSRFVAFDFETTGLDPSRDRIIEFAAVRFGNGQVEESLSTLVNPQKPIPPYVTSLTGITDSMVSDGPTEDEIVDDIMEFVGKDPLVAHNINFDLGFLKQLIKRHRPEKGDIDNITYDTLFLSQSFLFFLPSHRLRSVATYLGGDCEDEHRALADTMNVGHIFVRLIEEVCSYPLSMIQEILSVVKQVPMSTRELFVNLANHLVKESLFETGLVDSKIDKKLQPNIFHQRGRSRTFPSSADDLFGENGPFVRTGAGKGLESGFFEVRPAQISYSNFVARAFSESSIGITEAGTGLGKSLAYLFPALKAAGEGKGPTVISCYTKHLQDQLFFQEIPKLVHALEVPFTATLLKGRQNYLCKTRLERLIEDPTGWLSSYEIQSLVSVLVWLRWTRTGDFDECPGFLNRKSGRVRKLIQSEPGFCTRRACARHKGCFLGPIREACRRAHLIVVNHYFLLAELSNPGILPPVRRVIIDEAHNLGQVAYEHFQIRTSHRRIKNLLSSADRSSRRSRRLKSQVDTIAQGHPEVAKEFARVQESVENIVTASEQFFLKLSIEHAAKYDQNAGFNQRNRYKSCEEFFRSTRGQLKNLSAAVQMGVHSMGIFAKRFNELRDESVNGEAAAAIERLEESFAEIMSSIEGTAISERSDWVYWEEGRFENGGLILSLNGVPIDLGGNLAEILFRPLDSVVLTSATMRVGNSFDYVSSRLGIDTVRDKAVHAQTFPGPFNYEEQCRYFQWAGELSPNSPQFPGLVSDLIEHLHTKWRKRTMVLFTSWRTLEICRDELVGRGVARRIDLLVQRPNSSRTSLLTALKNSREGVLLGTRSFWEGVDLPKDLLEILVITKLPFDVPADPIVEAYGEKILEKGGNPFLEHAVPEAIMKLRQGFGRLIRTTHDEGIFINMDNRVVTREYGSYFRQAIPVSMEPFQDPSAL